AQECYARAPDARIREAAYRELYRVFAQHADVIGEVYKTLVTDWKQEHLSLRKHRSPIAVRNLMNDVPEEAVEALLAVCARNAGVFQDYVAIKARLCRIRKMSRYHIYAPFRESRRRHSFAAASGRVLDAYRGFSPRLADLAGRVLEERHVDVAVRPGKLGGAFCYSVMPGLTPYVLLNFKGQVRDIATLAHELGHAVHGMLAGDHSIFTFHAMLPLAETASVFGERLLSDALMADERDKVVKQGLVIQQLDDAYATIVRQAYFGRRERWSTRMTGAWGTREELWKVYLPALRQPFGRAVAARERCRRDC